MPFSKTLFFLASTPLFANFLYAETLWVQGVTVPKESDWLSDRSSFECDKEDMIDKSSVPTAASGQGWYDSNKIWPIVANTNDSGHCWAATASNMLEWWQAQNKDVLQKIGAELKYSGVVNDGTTENPHYSTKIYENVFVPAFKTGSGNVQDALNWYFNGGTIDRPRNDTSFTGAYYSDLEARIKEKVNADFSFNNLTTKVFEYTEVVNKTYDVKLSTISNCLKTALNGGKSIALDVGGHYITCWGADFDNEIVTTLYVADSDDNLNCGLRKINIVSSANKDSDIYTMEELMGEDAFSKYVSIDLIGVLSNNDKVYTYIENIYTLDTGRETLQMLAAAIPEPSMFGLFVGLGALALVGSRRRRK